MSNGFNTSSISRSGFVACAAVGLCLAPVDLAAAPSPSGKAVAVVQATSASGPGGSRRLAAAKPVYSGDRIKTGGSGQAQIVFADNTRLVVGSNSSIVIDKYVYRGKSSGAQVSMQLARGAFRFLSGGGSRRSFSITTPTATLGVRGTAFDVAVGGRIGTGVLVFEGAVRACSRRTGQCTIVRAGCNAAVVDNSGNLGSPQTRADRTALIRAAFPLAQRQSGLRSNFRVSTRACGSLSKRAARNIREINFSPAGNVVNNPPGGGGPGGGGGGPGGGGNNAPGASGNTKGGSKSTSSNASSNARSDPGRSGSSRAGGRGRGRNE